MNNTLGRHYWYTEIKYAVPVAYYEHCVGSKTKYKYKA